MCMLIEKFEFLVTNFHAEVQCLLFVQSTTTGLWSLFSLQYAASLTEVNFFQLEVHFLIKMMKKCKVFTRKQITWCAISWLFCFSFATPAPSVGRFRNYVLRTPMKLICFFFFIEIDFICIFFLSIIFMAFFMIFDQSKWVCGCGWVERVKEAVNNEKC